MKQETGETRDAIIEDDEKVIQNILDLNSSRKDPYWIVLFAKPSKVTVEGKPTLMKHIKPYFTRPIPKVGMCVAEVDPINGTLDWDINMPQVPFDFDALKAVGAEDKVEDVIETTSLPNAYVTK